ncbi:MAG: glycosyltransferase family 4 protein [Gammaproteobacteria bacterium]|nr:glycosyltransferase family 4 protein [Gammaproteobacteria bacterium]
MQSDGSKIKRPSPILFTHYGSEWIRGSERCLLDLLTYIDRCRYAPVVWCNSKAMAEATRELDIPVHESNFSLLFGWRSPRFDIPAFFSLVRCGIELVDTHDVQLLHANSGAPNQWLNLVARARHIPLLAHLHSRYPLRDRMTLGLHQVAMAVGVSQPVVDQLIQDGIPLARTCVIPNGIDTERLDRQQHIDLRGMLNLRSHEFLITTTGSLIQRKGIDLIIGAVSRLIRRNIPVRLAIIGDGPERSTLQQQVQRLGLEKCVHLLGEQSNVVGLLRGNADLFVSGAREEVFGLVLAEAGLAGLPVVAPAVGGIPGVVTDGTTGLLVPPGDTAALANAMHRLYEASQLRGQMGSAGRRHVLEHFSIQRNVQQFEQLYDKLLHDPAMQMRWNSHWQLRHPFTTGTRQLLNLTLGKSFKEVTP